MFVPARETTTASLLEDEESGGGMEDILQIFRIFKLARVLKLARHSPGLQVGPWPANSCRFGGRLCYQRGYLVQFIKYTVHILAQRERTRNKITMIKKGNHWKAGYPILETVLSHDIWI